MPTINADLLFNKERFTHNGIEYICTGEPWITGTPGNDKVHIPCRRILRNTNHVLTIPLGTVVKVREEPVR